MRQLAQKRSLGGSSEEQPLIHVPSQASSDSITEKGAGLGSDSTDVPIPRIPVAARNRRPIGNIRMDIGPAEINVNERGCRICKKREDKKDHLVLAACRHRPLPHVSSLKCALALLFS